jgi:hypothetical protein
MRNELTHMFVRPARPGLRVIDPVTRRPIPDEGAEVPRDGYWTRRRVQGDVVEVAEHIEPPAEVAPLPNES